MNEGEQISGVERPAIVELLSLAGPTVAQMASYTVMQFIDTWMLSRVGDRLTPPTAAGNSGMIAFAIISLGMGVLWVVNTLVSQSFGRRDYAACGRYLWQGIWFALGFSVLLLPALPFVSGLFTLPGHEPHMVRLETIYLQIVVGASFLKLISTAFGQFLLAIDRPNRVMAATIIGVAVNALAAWILVFGRLGATPHGVAGAAWAQNIGVCVEMTALIVFACQKSIRRTFNLVDFRPRHEAIFTLLKIGIPSGVQVVTEVLAWAAFSLGVMAAFHGAVAQRSMAANTFVFRYMSVSFMPAYGISIAVTALVGRYIGRGRPDIARRRANLGFALAAGYMLICGVFFFLARDRLIGLFAIDPLVRRAGATAMIFAAVYQCFDAMYIIYTGALRGAGDTLVPAIVTATLCWAITVAGGYAIARTFPTLGIAGPWSAATAYGVILGIFMLTRFRRGRWERIHLRDEEATAHSSFNASAADTATEPSRVGKQG